MSASSFFSDFADMMEDQLNLGENKSRTISLTEDGNYQKYGKLGDFANKIDQSEERRYVENGYLKYDQYSVAPRALQIMSQEPSATVLVKKRVFNSLSEYSRPEYMDADERLALKATAALFRNKCQQIYAYEKLTKLYNISKASELDDRVVPAVISMFDDFISASSGIDSFAGNPLANDSGFNRFSSYVDKLKKAFIFSKSTPYTTWHSRNDGFKSINGLATGVIEFTNFSQVTCSTSLRSQGSCNLSFEDPYALMVITELDIEKAIKDSVNFAQDFSFFKAGVESLDRSIKENTNKLNSIRYNRGAHTITFNVRDKITPIGRKVSAILDHGGIEIPFTYSAGLGALSILNTFGNTVDNSVTIDPNYLQGGDALGDEGISTGGTKQFVGVRSASEYALFTEIVQSIYRSIELRENADSLNFKYSDSTNYVRKELYFNYGDKLIIQPMDNVHIYFGSKYKVDDSIAVGVKTAENKIYNNLANAGRGVKEQISNLMTAFGGDKDTISHIEKSVVVGEDFPNYLWGMFRDQFLNENEGCHVFGGIVTNCSNTYSGQKYTVSVTCSDNSQYLTFGKVNENPAASVHNDEIYNPLTPFKTVFDDVVDNSSTSKLPELLNENKQMLEKGVLKNQDGANAGKKASAINSTTIERSKDRGINTVFYAPDGLAYKWKKGIGTHTFTQNSSINPRQETGEQGPYKDPFSNQDAMNIISLLVTGMPYNYINYYKGLRDSGNLKDPRNFMNALSNRITKNNQTWGNFIPFKQFTVTEEDQKRLFNLATLNEKTSEIQKSLAKIADLTRATMYASRINDAASISSNEIKNLVSKNQETVIKELAEETSKIMASVDELKKDQFSNLTVVGSDISYEPDDILNPTKQTQRSRKELRRKVNFLTRRLSWQVRSNEDRNLFIVDDSYEKDFDIHAFAIDLQNSIQTFNSVYLNARQKIESITSLLDLEFYCDSQGHLRCRIPRFNKIPSSVFFKLIQLKKVKGIDLFPKFMSNIFKNQLENAVNTIEAIEDEIRLYTYVLNTFNDNDVAIEDFINSNNPIPGSIFEFLSSNNLEGKIPDFQKLSEEASLDLLTEFDQKFSKQAKLKSVFSQVSQFSYIKKAIGLDIVADGNKFTTTLKNNSSLMNVQMPVIGKDNYFSDLVRRIRIKTGKQVDIDSITSFYKIKPNTSSPEKDYDIFKILGVIGDKLKERQKAVKFAYGIIKNLKDIKTVDQYSSTNDIAIDKLSGNDLPDIYESLIEDESYDDLGDGSGKRYIIRNKDILNYTISENTPEYTTVAVNGQLSVIAGVNPPQDLTFSNGGYNGLTGAIATDYDLWRRYGFREHGAINLPIISNPDTQCAPLAVSLLSRQRANILRASIGIVGNEYMQVGDVVYLEDRNLLFYVESVSHSFTFGGTFSTTMNLTYGHKPGEYIPSRVELLGKLLYNNRDKTNVLVKKNTNMGDLAIGAFYMSPAMTSNMELNPDDLKLIDQVKLQTYFILQSTSRNAPSSDGKSFTKNYKEAVIELRLFKFGAPPKASDNIIKYIDLIINKLCELDNKADTPNAKAIDKKNISVKIINYTADKALEYKDGAITTDDQVNNTSPSQHAMGKARELAYSNNKTPQGVNFETVQSYLGANVVDCVLTFRNADNSASEKKGGNK